MNGMRVLVVEDERLLAEELCDRLARLGLTPVGIADSSDTALALAERERPELVIMDVRLKGTADGIDTAAAIRATHDVALVYLTAHSDEASLERAQQTQPIGYLYKPFDERQLRATLALAEGRRRTSEDALRDPLTNCWNRRGLADIFLRESARGRRTRARLGLAIIDVDHFKPINDTHGHGAGDAVLVEVAGRIARAVRPYDSVVRYGGDEFVVVLPEADAVAMAEIAERIRHAIDAQPVAVEAARLTVSATIGTAVADAIDSIDSHAIIAAADASLYTAKRAGRNRVGAPIEVATP